VYSHIVGRLRDRKLPIQNHCSWAWAESRVGPAEPGVVAPERSAGQPATTHNEHFGHADVVVQAGQVLGGVRYLTRPDDSCVLEPFRAHGDGIVEICSAPGRRVLAMKVERAVVGPHGTTAVAAREVFAVLIIWL
jgi:hypothetical protein